MIPYDGTTALTPLTVQGRRPATGRHGLTNGTAYTFTGVGDQRGRNLTALGGFRSGDSHGAASVVVTNGGFESGLTAGPPLGCITPDRHRQGAHRQRFGVAGVTGGREPLGDSSLAQAIVVPATGGAMLSFWYQPHSDDRTCGSGKACTRDWMEARSAPAAVDPGLSRPS